ncbi:MAG: glycosyltransferase family 4 protein [Acidobacteria bacterium]|nr:glycosyltransferase family 4 protein [Acidobacteriota bacterium]
MKRRIVTFVCQAAPPRQNSTAQLLSQLLPEIAQNQANHYRLMTGSGSQIHIDGWQIIQLGGTSDGLWSKILFFLSAFVRLFFRPGNLIVATSNPPFNLWLLGMISRVRRVPVRYWVLDVYPEVLEQTGYLKKNGWFARLWRRLNLFFLKNIQQIMVIGKDMQAHFETMGVAPERLVYQPLWSIIPVQESPNLEIESPIRLQYSGNLGLLSNLAPLIRAVAARSDYTLEIIGSGSQKPMLLRLVADLGARNIHFGEFVPIRQLADSLSRSHVGVVSLRTGLAGLAVPCKIYGILAVGRPLLALVPPDSEVAHLVKTNGCGWVVSPDDHDQLESVFDQLALNPIVVQEAAERALTLGQLYSFNQALPGLIMFFKSW